jgi:hypothetical protein
LAEAPKTDDNNYSTLVNQGGEIQEGMLGEYVSLYDTHNDADNPHLVTTSKTNSDVTSSSSKDQSKSNSNDTKKPVSKEENSKNEVNQNNAQMNPGQNMGYVNTNQGFVQAGIQSNLYPQQGAYQQVMYVPVLVQATGQQSGLVNGQLISNMNNFQPVQQNMQQMGQPMVYYQPVNTGMQAQYVQNMQTGQQMQYTQQQVYMQQPVSGMQMSNSVGTGMNQVPTLVYLH